MKRTLSLVLALVMVLGTFTGVFAEEVDAELAAGLLLEQIGVLEGDQDGNLMLGNGLKRQDAVVLLSRLMGDEETAKNFPGAEEILTYEDIRDEEGNVKNEFYLPYLAWALSNEYFVGRSETEFGYGEEMSIRDYAVVLFRVLGYEEPAWSEVMEQAVELGLVEDAELVDFTRGTMALMTKAALNTVMKDSTITLAEHLEIEMPAPPAPAAVEVVEVVADNLKEVKVVFNQQVDKALVTNANVAVKGLKGSAALLEDGMTVVITMEDQLENQKAYTLVVDKVTTEKAEVPFTAFDATLPEALSVEVTGPRNLTVTFSEPMKEAGTLTIKQDKVNLGSAVDLNENQASVRAYTNFVEGKEYSVTVTGFKDYADYSNVINTLTFTYEKDENPPVATVEKAEQTYVIVSFDKPVTGLKETNFYHTFTAWTAEKIENMAGDPIKATDSVNKVKVYFIDEDGDGKAIPAGETVFGILGKNIKDNWGNALGNQEFTISTTADRIAPEVKSIKVKTERSLEVEFTKDVKFGRSNVDILDADGKNIGGIYIDVDGSGSKYTVDFGKKLAGKTITVSIKGVKDTTLYANELALYTEVIEVTDKTEPEVLKVYYSEIKEKDDVYTGSLYVVFDESVDADTALVDTNYSLVYGDSVTILKDAGTSFDVINSRVKLSLTSAQAKALKTETDKAEPEVKMLVINVKDLSGNAIKPMQKGLTQLSETKNVEYNVIATKTNQIKVEFDDLLSNIKMADFKVNNEDYGKGFGFTVGGDTATTIVFDLSEKVIKTDGSNVEFEIKTDHKIENSYDEVAVFTQNPEQEGKATDAIKPEIATTKDEDDKTIKDVKVYETGKVVIKFTEDMERGTFSTRTFGVEGKSVMSIDWNADDELVLNLNKAFETNLARVSYNQVGVEDKAGNTLDLDKGVFVEIEKFADVEEDPVEDEANKAALEALISTAKDLEEEDYTAETWTELQEAIEAAEAVVADGDATQAEVDAEVVALQEAIDGLEEVEEDEEPVVTLVVTFTETFGAVGTYAVSDIVGADTATQYTVDYVDTEDDAKTTPMVDISEETAPAVRNATVTVNLFDADGDLVATVEDVEVVE